MQYLQESVRIRANWCCNLHAGMRAHAHTDTCIFTRAPATAKSSRSSSLLNFCSNHVALLFFCIFCNDFRSSRPYCRSWTFSPSKSLMRTGLRCKDLSIKTQIAKSTQDRRSQSAASTSQCDDSPLPIESHK